VEDKCAVSKMKGEECVKKKKKKTAHMGAVLCVLSVKHSLTFRQRLYTMNLVTKDIIFLFIFLAF